MTARRWWQHSRALAFVLFTVVVGGTPLAAARELTFDERLLCQRSIEDVYWQHRTWPAANPGPKPALREVLSGEDLRAKVEDSLRRSKALEMWGRPITAEDLQVEMERIGRASQRPEMLRELVSALHDDPFLVAECLVRPILADRRIGALLDHDPAFADWWEEQGPKIVPDSPSVADTFLPMVVPTTTSCVNDTWMPTSTSGAPAIRYGQVMLWTGSEVAIYGGGSFIGTPGPYFDSGKLYDPTTDSWRTLPGSYAACGYLGGTSASGVWTGTRAIFWGGGYIGDFGGDNWNTGGRFDPAAGTWSPTSTGNGVPSPRWDHTAVWTGRKMIIWGGDTINSNTRMDTGGVYDPVSDSWRLTSTGGVCSGGTLNGHGCQDLNDCPGACIGGATPGSYCSGSQDCAGGCSGNSAIRCTSTTDCSTQGLGKCTAPSPGSCNGGSCMNTGYHPSARTFHAALWTGREMIIWGGLTSNTTSTNTGGRYDPETDTWTPTSTGSGAPGPGSGQPVWTGSRMVLWLGGPSAYLYDPVGDAWSLSSPYAVRGAGSVVWTGDEVILWGNTTDPSGNLGERYRPSTDTWTPTGTGTNTPAGRSGQTTVWTGNEMILWGGRVQTSYTNTGARYCATPACAVSTWYRDADGDGYGETGNTVLSCTQPPGFVGAPGDCNDASVAVHPGVAELCGDGIDNDCDGIADDAGALSGASALTVRRSAGGTISWTTLIGANGYDVVRGSLGVLAATHGDFTAATQSCIANDVSATATIDATTPAAGDGIWYLIRGENCAGAGTYNESSPSQVGSRDAEIQAAASACP